MTWIIREIALLSFCIFMAWVLVEAFWQLGSGGGKPGNGADPGATGM